MNAESRCAKCGSILIWRGGNLVCPKCSKEEEEEG